MDNSSLSLHTDLCQPTPCTHGNSPHKNTKWFLNNLSKSVTDRAPSLSERSRHTNYPLVKLGLRGTLPSQTLCTVWSFSFTRFCCLQNKNGDGLLNDISLVPFSLFSFRPLFHCVCQFPSYCVPQHRQTVGFCP